MELRLIVVGFGFRGEFSGERVRDGESRERGEPDGRRERGLGDF
jgi:hypothetical protein